MADWRKRTTRGTARVRGYFDVHPDHDSRLTLDPAAKNRWGDALPVIQHRIDAASQARQAATREHLQGVFSQARQGQRRPDGQRQRPELSGSSGRRLPDGRPIRATSVVDSFGRTHDHENLFVVGSPTLPTGGCTNGTLTFVALALRSVGEIAK